MDFNIEKLVQAIIAVFVIMSPLEKGAYFLILTRDIPNKRRAAAFKVTTVVALILVGTALVGKPALDAMGINLGAFGFAGGIILFLMGLEMMSGNPTRMQGDKPAKQSEAEVHETLMVPLTMPLIAGPGTITVVVTLAASSNTWSSTIYTLIAVGVSVSILLASFLLAERWFGKMKERTARNIARFGGLLIATIGVQLAFSGIKTFFSL